MSEEKKKKIGIVTTFTSLDPGYSLCAVVIDQLKGLVKNGYHTVLFVLPEFTDTDTVPEGVEIRNVVPQIILEPYKEIGFPEHWKEDVRKVKETFEKNMADMDFLICHDIFFIDTYLPYNIGLRDAKIDAKVLAWTHSAPSNRLLFEDNLHANRFNMPPRAKLVYLNHEKTVGLAEYYGTFVKDVRVVHNARDPRTFWNLDPFVISLIDKYDLLEADIVSIYPVSTPRMNSGKRLDQALLLHGKLKKLGYKTRYIIPNAHANAEKEKKQIRQTLGFAKENGLDPNKDIIFTSLEESPKYESGVSSKIISDLFRISNIFIFPTLSEVCSLVLLEAMLAGNLLVLNENVKSLREFGGDHALYFDFAHRKTEEETQQYYEDLAKIIASEFENDRSLQIKRHVFKNHNYDKIFKDLERLFYESDK